MSHGVSVLPLSQMIGGKGMQRSEHLIWPVLNQGFWHKPLDFLVLCELGGHEIVGDSLDSIMKLPQLL
jgi:hypothetical protein